MSNKCTRKNAARTLHALGIAAAGVIAFVQPAAAKTHCKIETVRSMSAVSDLCDCDIVTPGMLKHILRRSDSFRIIEVTSQECPRLARVLTDFPVASLTPSPTERAGGDEPSGRNFGGDRSSDGGREDDTIDGDDDDGSTDTETEENDVDSAPEPTDARR
jgi:hypothetical protein